MIAWPKNHSALFIKTYIFSKLEEFEVQNLILQVLAQFAQTFLSHYQ